VKKHHSATPSESSNKSEQLIRKTTTFDGSPEKPKEVGGPKGPEPTRYGDWEKAGRCTDF